MFKLSNLENIREKIARAALKSGRSASDITLVAVTKSRGIEDLKLVYQSGLRIFGENKVQEAQLKMPGLPSDIRWAMIGHLQSNKAQKACELFSMIQSVDSLKLLGKIDAWAQSCERSPELLLEFNLSQEEQKYGFSIERFDEILREVSVFKNVRIAGLMGMSALTASANEKKKSFERLRKCFEGMRGCRYPHIEAKHLSMGMSDDFEAAIEEGSTMVRIGRALFV